MYDTTERVRRAKHAARQLIRQREQKALRRLGALCAALALGLTGTLAHFTGGVQGGVQGAYGATLLSESAGGYVLVGVAAFVAAVVLTIVCMRLHEQEKRKNRNDENEKENTP